MSTCIFVRSCAIVKSVGADRDAATVCPTSTLREITMPSMGETMLVYERFTCGEVQLRGRLREGRVRGVDGGVRGRRVRLGRVEVGLRGEVLILEGLGAGVAAGRRRVRSPAAVTTPALAWRKLAWACCDGRLEDLRIDLGDELALLHLRVEVGISFWMRPETCVPTWTVTSAESVPLAVTLPTMRCCSTVGGLVVDVRGLVVRHAVAPNATPAAEEDEEGEDGPDSLLHRVRLPFIVAAV